MRNRIISLITSLVLLFTALPTVTFAAEEKKIDSVQFGEKQYLGYPLQDAYVDTSAISTTTGKNILGTVIEGSPAIFYAYDLDENKVLGMFPIEGAAYSHSMGVAPNGDIYITTQTNSYLARYNVRDNTFDALGKVPGDKETATYGISFDENSNVYFGTYPSAKVIKYDIKEKKFHDYGTVFEGQKYVRAAAYHDGYLYVGGYDDNTKFSRVDVKTGVVEGLPAPVLPGVLEKGDIKLFYFMTKISDEDAGNYIIAHIQRKSGGNVLAVYDLNKSEWYDFIASGQGYKYPDILDNGKTYFSVFYPEYGKSRLSSYNIKTKELVDLGIDFGSGLRGSAVVTMKDQERFPGKSVVTVNYDTGCPTVINLQNKSVTVLEEVRDQIVLQPIQIRSIGSGTNGLVGYGGYKAREAGVYNTASGKFTNIPMGQVEGLAGINGIFYYGQYSGATLMAYNPKNPIDEYNPVQVAKLGNSQDRIFQIIEAEGKVVMCSTPVTTALGGAVSIYDPATGKTDVYRNVSKDQSITSALYLDGKLYLGTHIWGGLSTKPTTTTAKVLVFDMKTRKVVKEMTPVIPGYDSPICSTGDLVLGDDGLIWAASSGTIFAFDKDTLEIKKSKVIDPTPQKPETAIFFGMPLDKLKNGLFIAKFAYGIYLFDPETLESKKISDTTYRFTLAEDGNIYSTDYRNFIKIPVYYKGDTAASQTEAKDKLGKSIALLLGKSTALVNGTEKQIDADNKLVVAKEIKGRTMIPFRFVGESLGAEVTWDKATNTATLKKDGKTIQAVLGKSEIVVNGVSKKIDTQIIDEKGRILLPLRAFAEALGKTVYWDDRGIVLISDAALYSNNNKQLLDQIYSELRPDVKTDPLENGTKSPLIEELKKLVNKIEPVETITSTPVYK